MTYAIQEARMVQAITWLEEIVWGDEDESVDVGGVSKPSISKAIDDNFELLRSLVQGTRAFLTKDEMDLTAWVTDELKLARVVNDPVDSNNGLYYWKEPDNVWTKTIYDTDTFITALVNSVNAELINNRIVADDVNILDLSKSTDGYAISPDNGAIYAAELYRVTSLIPVIEGKNYHTNGGITGAFFDSTKSFLSGFSGVAELTVPSNALYIRYQLALTKEEPMLMASVCPDYFVKYGWSSELAKPVDEVAAAIAEKKAASEVAFGALPSNRNLVIENDLSLDTAMSSNGAVYSQSNWITSAKISVYPAMQWVANFSFAHVVYYDISGAKLEDSVSTSSGASYVVPDTAFYIRFSLSNTDRASKILLIAADALPDSGYESGLLLRNDALKLVDNQLSLANPLNTNLFDKDRSQADKALSTNGAVYAQSSWVTSSFIPVTPLKTLVSSESLPILIYFDSVQNILSDISVTKGTAFEVPKGAYYVRFHFNGLSKALSLMLVEGVLPDYYVPFSPDHKYETVQPWWGKNFGVAGDSITAYLAYQTTVSRNLGMNLIFDDGVAGRAMRGMTENMTAANLADVDLLVIFAGTNDYGGNRAIGSISDGLGAGAFYSDVRDVIDTVYTLKSDIRLCFWTPLSRGDFPDQPVHPAANSAGVYLQQYVDAIIEVASEFGIPVLDLYRNSGFNEYNLADKTVDNLHPSDDGFSDIVRVGSSFIRQL